MSAHLLTSRQIRDRVHQLREAIIVTANKFSCVMRTTLTQRGETATERGYSKEKRMISEGILEWRYGQDIARRSPQMMNS